MKVLTNPLLPGFYPDPSVCRKGEDYYLGSLFAIPFLGNIFVILFWATIGCSIYCLIWGLSNTIKEVSIYDETANKSVC